MIKYDFIKKQLDRIDFGKSVFLLGTATDGPVNEPVRIKSPDEAINKFGSKDSGTLVKGYIQAYNSFPDLDYYLVRMTGTYAKAKLVGLDDSGKVKNALILRSKGAGERYNHIKANLLKKLNPKTNNTEWCIEIHPDPNSPLNPITYFFSNYGNIGLLTRAINDNASIGVSPVYAFSDMAESKADAILGFNDDETWLSDGDDGLDLSKNEMYVALEYTLNLLEGLNIDAIVLLGLYFDDVHDPSYYGSSEYGQATYIDNSDFLTLTDSGQRVTYHGLLADFCMAQHKFGIMSHGFIGFRPISDPHTVKEMAAEYVNMLIKSSSLNTRYGLYDQEGIKEKDKGYYISLVLGDFLFDEASPSAYWDNGVAAYAALWIASGYNKGTTNLELPNITKQRLLFDGPELKILTNNGVVTFRYSPLKKALVVNSGVTPSSNKELFQDANVKMMQHTIYHVNAVVDMVIGQDASLDIILKDLEESLNKTLSSLQEQNVIPGFEFNITKSSYNHWKLDLSLKGKSSLEEINVPIDFVFGG